MGMLRTIGIKCAEAKITLVNLADNMNRLTFHGRRAGTGPVRLKNGKVVNGRPKGVPIALQKAKSVVNQPKTLKIPSNRSVNGGAPMWSTDFASDALLNGRRLRALTVVDAFTPEVSTAVRFQSERGAVKAGQRWYRVEL